MPPSVVVIGPMAPLLADGIAAIIASSDSVAVRRCGGWAHLAHAVGGESEPLVVLGIDDAFDRDRAFELSLECPDARIVTCELHRPELSVMRDGRALGAGPATVAGLGAILGL